MNKDEKKRLINAFYGVNKNKELEKSHVVSNILKTVRHELKGVTYTDTDSIIKRIWHAGIYESLKANWSSALRNSFDIETERGWKTWKNIIH